MTIKEELVQILQDQGYDVITACGLVTDFLNTVRSKETGKYYFFIGKVEVTIQVKKCICGQGIGIVKCPIHGFTGGLRPIQDVYYRKEKSIGKNTNEETGVHFG